MLERVDTNRRARGNEIEYIEGVNQKKMRNSRQTSQFITDEVRMKVAFTSSEGKAINISHGNYISYLGCSIGTGKNGLIY